MSSSAISQLSLGITQTSLLPISETETSITSTPESSSSSTTTFGRGLASSSTGEAVVESSDPSVLQSQSSSLRVQPDITETVVFTRSTSESAAPSTQTAEAGGTSSARRVGILAGTIVTVLFLVIIFLFVRCVLPRDTTVRRFFERRRREHLRHTNSDQLESSADSTEAGIQRPVEQMMIMRDENSNVTRPNRSVTKAAFIQSSRKKAGNRPVGHVVEVARGDTQLQQHIEEAATPDSSTRAMSVVLQEIQSLRTRMDELVRQQHQEAARSFPSTLSDIDDGRTAPPSYYDGGER